MITIIPTDNPIITLRRLLGLPSSYSNLPWEGVFDSMGIAVGTPLTISIFEPHLWQKSA